ncbi:hypothetical protein N657DRAFT_649651 [Parathielavia appendiculata]|uniref:GPI anchored serine-threonine rich protein n=1 Tax=Parathielavia appendiculata TaxID=2587402 RepID=A0AAN6TSH8_9PEZI|nr:hypothetical protein N657DRAFT_649651 [Parathielavia appendiculata]
MRLSLIAVVTALGVADAANNLLSSSWTLNKRQGEAFDPDEDSRPGANCVDAFGPGYIECRPESATQNRLCINPDEGETCCSNLWGCPAGSFCLIDDLCCPEGLDPQTCAADNNVSLPPDFGATTTTSTPTETSTVAPSSSTAPSTTSTLETTSSSETTSAPGSTSTSTTATTQSTRSAGNSTTSSTTSTSRPIVTAGAYREQAGIAAAMLGLVAAIAI